MKKLLIMALALSIMTACKDNKATDTQQAETTQAETTKSDGGEYEHNGIYSIYREPVIIDSEDKTFHVEIRMSPDTLLPTVYNENFNRTYADNHATIVVVAKNDTIFSKQFTKATFAEYIDSSIAGRAILCRIAYRGATANQVNLEAEVSVPHSDEECYITMTILGDGTLQMQRYINNEVPDEVVD